MSVSCIINSFPDSVALSVFYYLGIFTSKMCIRDSYNCEYSFITCNGDSDLMLNTIQTLAGEGVKGFFVDPDSQVLPLSLIHICVSAGRGLYARGSWTYGRDISAGIYSDICGVPAGG